MEGKESESSSELESVEENQDLEEDEGEE